MDEKSWGEQNDAPRPSIIRLLNLTLERKNLDFLNVYSVAFRHLDFGETRNSSIFSKSNIASSGSLMSIQMNPCPCGLSREELTAHHLVIGGRCTAPRLDNEALECGVLLARHPSSAQAQPGERKSIWIFCIILTSWRAFILCRSCCANRASCQRSYCCTNWACCQRTGPTSWR